MFFMNRADDVKRPLGPSSGTIARSARQGKELGRTESDCGASALLYEAVRRDGNGSRPGEHHDEPREDRQVGVKAGPLQPLQRSAAERARSTPRTAARLVR
jgi:hypothetical protein